MLEHDDCGHAAAKLIDALPCNVQIPAQWRDNFEKHGPMPVSHGERRRYSRLHCRSEKNRAAMQCQPTLPQLKREPTWHSVYVANISREGLGLLHSEALYPREKLSLIMRSGKKLRLEVVNCRRVNTGCFEIGTEIVAGDAPTG
jgi:hypothetical protein